MKVPSVLALVIALSLPTMSAPARGAAGKGELVALSGSDLSVMRRYRGTARGDEFGSAYGFDTVPGRSTAGLLIGAPGANQVWVFDPANAQAHYVVDGEGLAGGAAIRFGHEIADVGHVGGASAVHWAVGAPSDPVAGSRPAVAPAVVFLHAAGATLGERSRLTGELGSAFGWSVATFDDTTLVDSFNSFLAVGAPRQDADTGAVHAHDAVTGALLWSRAGTRAGEHFGYSLLVVADRDGDSIHDLWVGAPGSRDREPAGRVALLSGKTGAVLASIAAPAAARLYGLTLASAPFGDGSDLAVGAPATTVAGMANAGAVYLSSSSARGGIQLTGERADDWFGIALASVLDRDGDGHFELAVSSIPPTNSRRPDSRGRVAIFDGAGNALLQLSGKRRSDYLGVPLLRQWADLDRDGSYEVLASITRAAPAWIPE